MYCCIWIRDCLFERRRISLDTLKKFQYNISYQLGEENKEIGFHSKANMIDYLNKNKNYLNKLNHVYLNFKTIKLSIKQSTWKIK